MARILHCLPIFLAFIALPYVECNEDDKTTWEVTEEVKDCERRTKIFDKLSIHYIGYITETGVKFDSTRDHFDPFVFQLGTSEVIKGWDEGLKDMCVKEKRKLKIPASKAYGEQGAGEGRVPPNADLTFDVELLKIEDGEAPPDIFSAVDANKDGKISRQEMREYLEKKSEESEDKDPEFKLQHKEVIDQIFDAEDENKDDHISHAEFSGPKHPRDEL